MSEAAAQARRRGARVLVGQYLDLEEGGLPCAPFVDVLRTLERGLSAEDAATLGPLLSLLGRGDGPGRRGRPPATRSGQARLFELLLTVVERLVRSGPWCW